MTAVIRIIPVRQAITPRPRQAQVNTTASKGGYWGTDLSPFKIGPCELYGEFVSENMENAWQFSKVYKCHLYAGGNPSEEYFEWAQRGWADFKAHRYPMGKGTKPEYSLWQVAGVWLRLNYIDARKFIYAPLYAEAVMKTKGWDKLKKLYETNDELVLRDYDGYDYVKMGRTLTEILNDPRRKMGHAFVLAMLLTNDPALEQCKLRGPVV